MHDTIAPPTDDLLTAMRQFIADQGEKRSDVTRDRYLQVAHDLEVFMAGVDVAPLLGRSWRPTSNTSEAGPAVTC